MNAKDLIVAGAVPLAMAIGVNSASADTMKTLDSKIISFEKKEPAQGNVFYLEPDDDNNPADITVPDTTNGNAGKKVDICLPDSVGFELKTFADTWTMFNIDNSPDAFFYHLENVGKLFLNMGDFTVNLGGVVEISSDPAFERHIANEKDIGNHRLALKFNTYNLIYKHNGLEMTLGKYLHPNTPNTERRIKHAGFMAKYSKDNLFGIDNLTALVSIHGGENIAFEKGPGLYRIELSGYEVIGSKVKMNFNLGFTGYENSKLGDIRLTNDPDAKFNIADFSLSFDMEKFKISGMISDNFSADRGLSYNAMMAFKFGKELQNELSVYHEMLQRNCAYDMHTAFAGPYTDYQLYALNSMFQLFEGLKMGPSIAWLNKFDGKGDWFNAFTLSALYKIGGKYGIEKKRE